MADEEHEIPEDELIRVRREKLARIVELGFDPYPTLADTDHTIPDVVAQYGGKPAQELEAGKPHVKVAGRIMLKRVMGKASFATIQDMSGSIQLYITDSYGDLTAPLVAHWNGSRWSLHGMPLPDSEQSPPMPPGVLDDTGGEPLANSGFEGEEPEPAFEERS